MASQLKPLTGLGVGGGGSDQGHHGDGRRGGCGEAGVLKVEEVTVMFISENSLTKVMPTHLKIFLGETKRRDTDKGEIDEVSQPHQNRVKFRVALIRVKILGLFIGNCGPNLEPQCFRRLKDLGEGELSFEEVFAYSLTLSNAELAL